MPFPRAAGILLHPTSLPSRGGVGDFGPAAYQFVDFLASARQGLWQVLPLGPLGYGNSPYSSTSAFAGNPLLISLERLSERGWIDLGKPDSAKLADLPIASGPVEYDQVFARKMPLLFEAARNFVRSASGDALHRFESFRAEHAWWLEDFVLFDALRARQKLESWNHWPRDLAHREPAALEKARQDLGADIQIRSALQFAFYEQWRALRRYCSERAIRVVGDVAIFMNHDSADVWTHRELFRLNENLEPVVVAGVPPDFFSKTGQRWGNPLYRWDVMKERGYEWWIQRLRWATQNCDYIRLDHFRGFDQFWEIPASDATAVNGRWVDGPRWAACRSLPKTWATSLRRSTPCGTGCRFREWPFCNLVSETKARTFTCRIAPKAKSSTRARTTTTPSRAGGIPARRSTSAAMPRRMLDVAKTAFIGLLFAPRNVPRRA